MTVDEFLSEIEAKAKAADERYSSPWDFGFIEGIPPRVLNHLNRMDPQTTLRLCRALRRAKALMKYARTPTGPMSNDVAVILTGEKEDGDAE